MKEIDELTELFSLLQIAGDDSGRKADHQISASTGAIRKKSGGKLTHSIKLDFLPSPCVIIRKDTILVDELEQLAVNEDKQNTSPSIKKVLVGELEQYAANEDKQNTSPSIEKDAVLVELEQLPVNEDKHNTSPSIKKVLVGELEQHTVNEDELNTSPSTKKVLVAELEQFAVNEDKLNTSPSIRKDTFNYKYYGVAVPEEAEPVNDPLVFDNLKDTLLCVKTCKGARFKEFRSLEDARSFASIPLRKSPEKIKEDSDQTQRKSPTPQNLTQLRKFIERGDELSFMKTVWQNPKSLIGESDIPTIVQEGARYNALHVAAKGNKAVMCQLILNTIEDPKFLQMLYPKESESAREKRKNQVLDLYLNVPDKKTGDTALHYACKFGSLDAAKVLLSHPACVVDKKNMDGLTPRDIICKRVNEPKETLVKSIEEAFNGLCYVPILRAEKNEVPPIIGRPCCRKDIDRATQGDNRFTQGPTRFLKAFAGPMSKEIAERFYRCLRHPSSPHVSPYGSEDRKVVSAIRVADSEKGVERIGRLLAQDMNVDWREFFKPLNIFANLASEEGLVSLEAHLKMQYKAEPYSSGLLDNLPEEQSLLLVHRDPPHLNPLGHHLNVYLNREKERQTQPSSELEDSDDDEYLTPPTSPTHDNDSMNVTPSTNYPHNDDDIFIEGSTMTRYDIDCLLAIGTFKINPVKYYYVTKWKSLVEFKLRSLENADPSERKVVTPLASVIVPRIRDRDESKSDPRRKLF